MVIAVTEAQKSRRREAAKNKADAARHRAVESRQALGGRWDLARSDYRACFDAAAEAYESATEPSVENPHTMFLESATLWDEAAAVDIPPALQSADDELTSVRSVAKEWLAAALTLFGLFSFTALFFGDETLEAFDHRSWMPVVFFLVAAVVAVTAAVFCCFRGTRAAHGWPTKQEKMDRQLHPLKRRNTLAKLDKARNDLYVAVIAAGVTVAAIAFAVGVVFYVQATDPPPVQAAIVVNGQRVACGTYKAADKDGITVTPDELNEAGVTEPISTPWVDNMEVELVRDC